MVSQDTKRLPYKILGFGCVAVCLILLVMTIYDMDLLFLVFIIAVLGTGLIYLLFGFGKFRVNRVSNVSVIIGLIAAFIAVVPPGLLIIFIIVTQSDPMGMILAFIPWIFAGVLALVSLALLLVSVLVSIKKTQLEEKRAKDIFFSNPRKD